MNKPLFLAMGLFSITAIAQTGKVGINNEKPTATLSVKSKTGKDATTQNLQLENAENVKLVTVLDNGNVGIGIENPIDAKLEIKGSEDLVTRFLGKDGTSVTDFYMDNNTLALYVGDKKYSTPKLYDTTIHIYKNPSATTPAKVKMNADVDIEGKVKITDGTQGSGKVLTSDGQGNASWALLGTPGNLVTQYKFIRKGLVSTIGYNKQTDNTVYTREVATSYTTPVNEIPSSIISTNGEFINFAKGKYLIFINHDLPYAEYCNFIVRRKSDNSIIYKTYYGEWLNTSFLLNLEKNDSIYFDLVCFAENNNPQANPNPTFYNDKAFYNNTEVHNTVTILQLH